MVKKIFTKKRFPLATIAIIITLLISSLPFVIPVKAALSSAKDTITTSQAGVVAGHSFVFTPGTTTSIKTIDFKYCTTASGTCTAPSGMVLVAAPQLGTVSGISGTGYTPSATNTNCTGSGNTDCTITLTVTTPSTQALAPANVPFLSGITNPTTTNTAFYVRITTKDGSAVAIDTATVAFATLTGTSMAVTASVDPTFSFSIAPVSSGFLFTDQAAINVTTNTSATTIPFGNVAVGTPKIAAHDITISSNSIGGYVVTASASANPPLTDGGSNNIDYFTGSNASPATWTAPNGVTANANSGFFGYTTESTTLVGTGGTSRFTTNKWAGMTTTADPIASNTTYVSSEVTRVGWQVAVNSLQPAGNYTGTVILVATPTY